MEVTNEVKNDVQLQGDPQPEQVQDDINLNFGEALQIMKNGGVVAREGWNGKDMYVHINRGSIPADKTGNESPAFCRRIRMKLFEVSESTTMIRLPNFNMKTADNCILTGWIPTQTDLLSEDWYVILDTKGAW